MENPECTIRKSQVAIVTYISTKQRVDKISPQSLFAHFHRLYREYSIVAMMASLWCLFVFIVAALTQNANGTTAIRSHYNRRGRIKGESTNDMERHLQVDEQRNTKKHAGNILLTLDQVVRLTFL